MVQLDDVDNTARLIAAFARRLDGRRVVRAVTPPLLLLCRHRRDAAPACLDRARAGAASSARAGPRRRSESTGTVEAAGRTDGRSRATCSSPPGVSPRSTSALTTWSPRCGSTTSCARPTCRRGGAGDPRAARPLSAAARRVPPLARHRQLRADRAAQARARGHRALVPRGAGRLRLRRRGPRALPADRPRARRGRRGRASARSSSATRRATSRARGRTRLRVAAVATGRYGGGRRADGRGLRWRERTSTAGWRGSGFGRSGP